MPGLSGFDPFDAVRRFRERTEGEAAGGPRTDTSQLQGVKNAAAAAAKAKTDEEKRQAKAKADFANFIAMFGDSSNVGGTRVSNLPYITRLPQRTAGQRPVGQPLRDPDARLPNRGYSSNRALGQQLAAAMGWTGAQWDAYDKLVMKESGWNNQAQNPKSTAYGIGQFLDSTWKGYGAKTADPRAQIQYMLQYIKGRYGDPSRALQFHLRNNWY